jgi:hypothetical protein
MPKTRANLKPKGVVTTTTTTTTTSQHEQGLGPTRVSCVG